MAGSDGEEKTMTAVMKKRNVWQIRDKNWRRTAILNSSTYLLTDFWGLGSAPLALCNFALERCKQIVEGIGEKEPNIECFGAE